MLHDQPRLRRLILMGTPLLTGVLLLFHPRPNAAEMGLPEQHLGTMDVYALLSPVVDRFLAIHVLFALAIPLLGLSVILLLDGLRGVAAKISRVSAFLFVVTYMVYETIIGTVTALLVRGAAALPPDEQAVISAAINRMWVDPLLGDAPSVLFLAATLSWPLAVILAAIALRRSGLPLLPCILLGLSSMFTIHASPLGSAGMLLFLLAVIGVERARLPAAVSVEYRPTPSS